MNITAREILPPRHNSIFRNIHFALNTFQRIFIKIGMRGIIWLSDYLPTLLVFIFTWRWCWNVVPAHSWLGPPRSTSKCGRRCPSESRGLSVSLRPGSREDVMVSTVQTRVYTQPGLNIPWFAQVNRTVPWRQEEEEEEEAELPSDPRTWSRAEVTRWVESVCSRHSLPLPSQDRFMMNGKAVCLMTAAMFCNRVPLGGKTLYRDFQIRLAKALNN